MGLKMAYQLPIVCGSPPLSLRASVDDGSGTGGVLAWCDDGGERGGGAVALPSRSDYTLGLHKYYGPASLPRDEGLFVSPLPPNPSP